MAELTNANVKRGFWIDWSQGRVFGATITVTAKASNVIVALLAVLVAVACTHLWNMMVFVFHLSRARRDKADGLFRQQQALIRTVPTPAATIVDLIKLAIVWRRRATNVYKRCLVPVLLVTIYKLAAVAAGIFVSYAVTSDNPEVLVTSPEVCLSLANRYYASFDQYSAALITESFSYSSRCYTGEKTPPSCQVFVKPQIETNNTASACPFDPSICSLQDNAAITLDSGLLDSNDVFGVNAPPHERIKYRRKVTCAPLKFAPYTTRENVTDFRQFMQSDPPPDDEAYVLHYARVNGYNFSYYFDPDYCHYLVTYAGYGQNSYEYGGYGPQGFDPIPQLQLADADLTLSLIFTCGVSSYVPVDDPVFAAHREVTRFCPYCEGTSSNFLPNGSVIEYVSDEPLGLIGCATQYQFCAVNADGGLDCGDLGGLDLESPRAKFPQASAIQLATMDLFTNVTAFVDMSAPLMMGNNEMIKANEQVGSRTLTNGLPSNQWEIEVQAWDAIVWASTQEFVAFHAIGYPIPANFTYSPASPEEQRLCHSQKMVKPGGFANVSVFGLAFVIAISCSLVILDMVFLKVLIFMPKFRQSALGPRLDQWIQDGVLQLQRRAYEAIGEGEWSKTDKEFPVTALGDRLSGFANLDKTNEKLETISSDTGTVSPTTNAISSDPEKGIAAAATRTVSSTASVSDRDSEKSLLSQDATPQPFSVLKIVMPEVKETTSRSDSEASS